MATSVFEPTLLRVISNQVFYGPATGRPSAQYVSRQRRQVDT